MVYPSISLFIANRFNEVIAGGMSVQVGDPLQFKIALNRSGNLHFLHKLTILGGFVM